MMISADEIASGQIADLFGIAEWMEGIESRLDETTRYAVEYHQRSTRALRAVLSAIAKRLVFINNQLHCLEAALPAGVAAAESEPDVRLDAGTGSRTTLGNAAPTEAVPALLNTPAAPEVMPCSESDPSTPGPTLETMIAKNRSRIAEIETTLRESADGPASARACCGLAESEFSDSAGCD